MLRLLVAAVAPIGHIFQICDFWPTMGHKHKKARKEKKDKKKESHEKRRERKKAKKHSEGSDQSVETKVEEPVFLFV